MTKVTEWRKYQKRIMELRRLEEVRSVQDEILGTGVILGLGVTLVTVVITPHNYTSVLLGFFFGMLFPLAATIYLAYVSWRIRELETSQDILGMGFVEPESSSAVIT